jgi:hypothetical protein
VDERWVGQVPGEHGAALEVLGAQLVDQPAALGAVADDEQPGWAGHPVAHQAQQPGEQQRVLARLEAADVRDQRPPRHRAVPLVQPAPCLVARRQLGGQRHARADHVQPVAGDTYLGEAPGEVLADDAVRRRPAAERALQAREQQVLGAPVPRPEAGHRQRVHGGRPARGSRCRPGQHAGLRLVCDDHRVLRPAEQTPEGEQCRRVPPRGDLPHQRGQDRHLVGPRLLPGQLDVGLGTEDQVVP